MPFLSVDLVNTTVKIHGNHTFSHFDWKKFCITWDAPKEIHNCQNPNLYLPRAQMTHIYFGRFDLQNGKSTGQPPEIEVKWVLGIEI